MPFPKPIKAPPRARRRMRRGQTPLSPIGSVGRARLELNKELTKQALEEGWLDFCELKAVLVLHKLAEPRCYGNLTFAHSRKHRGGSDELNHQVCRGCEGHHYWTLDLLPPKLARLIVIECIERRSKGE